ncbi:ubiquitin-protein ligase [Lithospermum erythrorhizon]|uniref:RING-type E3 ubiquitin transferase n=1 Tax=Lithospermum erythrorhizon TaxID=34254 RepID=A0AAV3QYY8_LITER
MSHDNDDDLTMQNNDQNEYALSGKILLIAIIILFALVVFILLLNLFARWRINRAHRRELRRRHRLNRRTQLFFYVNNNNRVPGSATLVVANRGLEPEVLNSLPVFVFNSSKGGVEALQCAVCLSEFEDDDKGRVLPKCGHIFHAECVDMWFHAHATCPLCRSNVELVKEPEMCDRLDELEPSRIAKSRRLSLRRLLSINRKPPMDVTTSYVVGTIANNSMEIETDLETGELIA